VGKGFALALLIGTPIGFMLGLSRTFYETFDPIIQFLRPISPLAWLPLGLVIFQKSEPAAVFTIALCDDVAHRDQHQRAASARSVRTT
jgi:nitrate/nitrite transport system permease protein